MNTALGMARRCQLLYVLKWPAPSGCGPCRVASAGALLRLRGVAAFALLFRQVAQRWLKAGVFEALVHNLRAVLRLAEGRAEQPSAVIFHRRTLQSTPESGQQAGYDGAKRCKGSQTHLAVDTLGHLLALYVTPADEQDRA